LIARRSLQASADWHHDPAPVPERNSAEAGGEPRATLTIGGARDQWDDTDRGRKLDPPEIIAGAGLFLRR